MLRSLFMVKSAFPIHWHFYRDRQDNIAESLRFLNAPRMERYEIDTKVEIETREEVMFFDTDCGGVVHNLAYLRMIETCRTRLAAKLGMDLREMATTGVYPVLTRTEVDYRKPAKLGDWITIRGKLGEVSSVRFWCEFEMHRESDGALLVTAKQCLALVKMPEGKPQRLILPAFQ